MTINDLAKLANALVKAGHGQEPVLAALADGDQPITDLVALFDPNTELGPDEERYCVIHVEGEAEKADW